MCFIWNEIIKFYQFEFKQSFDVNFIRGYMKEKGINCMISVVLTNEKKCML